MDHSLSNSKKLLAMPYRATQDGWVMVPDWSSLKSVLKHCNAVGSIAQCLDNVCNSIFFILCVSYGCGFYKSCLGPQLVFLGTLDMFCFP